MRDARIEKQLNKKVYFQGLGGMSYRELFINHVVRVDFRITNNMDKFNRTKFNRMTDNKKQDDYILRLKKPIKKYFAYTKDKCFLINILLFDGFKNLNDGLTINMRWENEKICY